MDRQRTLLQLAQKMSAAIASQDWKTLAAINTLMATALPQMAAQGQWSSSERAALAALRGLHEQAVQACNAATEDLGRRLHDMQANKEGWLAYALDSEQLETGIQA
ncbi:hypothetical protein D0T25_21670 [Duganella sp. BJB488]|uniref:Flagellar protein FliT n=1 Tax=Duganella vulcania TaxID=2692166 RepID=A0A845GWZ4_9BURK|nr:MULTISPECIES: hypothetical protein [Duganella]MYM98963.1 hypothetical protein [Duganella vulcania]MYN21073.1 hypothetical protein [Duganella vulcania]NVD69752.1 hypothetical protein [Duganella sp. BJB1802]RFP10235.1 hypothetical protein D0T26_27600 [Duganella sp. BJB489]RFP18166.1 hypothetical protein D0T25_21670 [Duganella sp. BJB488]